MKFLLPQGIGDSVWGLYKVQSILKKFGEAGDNTIEIYLNCSENSIVESRALEFVRRFKFVDRAEMYQTPILSIPPVDEEGRYNYMGTGFADLPGLGRTYILMPNQPLERGIRLENWMPELETNWDIVKQFRFYTDEVDLADNLHRELGDYAVLFLGSLASNTICGHNRNGIWKPEDWIDLGKFLINRGLQIVVVGAKYDLDYYTQKIEPILTDKWHCKIGQYGIGETFAICKRSRLITSYQAGIGIFSSYLGVPTAIFWRAKGDSVSPDMYISFEESMAEAWANPAHLGTTHMPLIYGKHDCLYLQNEMIRRNWVSSQSKSFH